MWSCSIGGMFRTIKRGRGNAPEAKDRKMGNIVTMSKSNLVTAHGIFNSIIEKAMQKVMYSIPDMTDAKKVVVTSGVIDGTEDALVYGARNKKIA